MGNKSTRKTVTGRVISDKMDKMITVQWEVKKSHPLYKKFITRHRKVKAKDEKNEAAVGDVVKIAETRPLSKTCCWRMISIVEKAQEEA